MSHPNVVVENEETTVVPAVPESEIALLAYALWEKRGRPVGTPEEDWFQAERSLKLKKMTRSFGVRLSSQIANAANK